jgi:hypothetical protein
VTTAELRLLVEGVRYLSAALAAPVDKDEVARALALMRALFGRSLVARVPDRPPPQPPLEPDELLQDRDLD